MDRCPCGVCRPLETEYLIPDEPRGKDKLRAALKLLATVTAQRDDLLTKLDLAVEHLDRVIGEREDLREQLVALKADRCC